MIDPLKHKGLIYSTAIRLKVPFPIEDSEEYGDGWIGLLRACKGYDSRLGRFSIYAIKAIRNEMIRGRCERGGLGVGSLRQHPLRFEQMLSDIKDARGLSPIEKLLAKERRAIVRKAMQNLSSINRCLLVERFWRGRTQKNIAECVGLSRITIQKRLNTAFLALRASLKSVG